MSRKQSPTLFCPSPLSGLPSGVVTGTAEISDTKRQLLGAWSTWKGSAPFVKLASRMRRCSNEQPNTPQFLVTLLWLVAHTYPIGTSWPWRVRRAPGIPYELENTCTHREQIMFPGSAATWLLAAAAKSKLPLYIGSVGP